MRVCTDIIAPASKANTPELQRLMDLEQKTHSAEPEERPLQMDAVHRRVHELLSPASEFERVTVLERTTYGVVELEL